VTPASRHVALALSLALFGCSGDDTSASRAEDQLRGVARFFCGGSSSDAGDGG